MQQRQQHSFPAQFNLRALAKSFEEMGNCCKPYVEEEDSAGDSRERSATYDGGRDRLVSYSAENSSKASSGLDVDRRRSTLNRDIEGRRARDQFDGNGGRQLLLGNQSNSYIPMHAAADRRDQMEYVFRAQGPGSGRIPRARQGEQVAAGWPSWLTQVAGEAVRGLIPRNIDSFQKMDKIGQGTYSNVFRARDLEDGKIVALKKIKFDICDPKSICFMAREIHILRRLHHPNVIKLEGVAISITSFALYLVFEHMEYDLAGLASRFKLTEPQIKRYVKQLFNGLEYCHRRGILHRDIKCSNLLIDKDGVLKLADFGLANYYFRHQAQDMTSRVITLWYRPPELLLGATRYGPAVDLWSTGCVIAELYAGTPILTGISEGDQLHKIFKLCGTPSEEYWRVSQLPYAAIFKNPKTYRRRIAERFKNVSSPALALIDTLLSIDPAARQSAAHALNSEFLSRPLACELEELPKYPPSKELDTRARYEEARRQAEGGSEGKRHNVEKFNPRQEEAASGFPIKPPHSQARDEVISGPEGTLHRRASHSGTSVQRFAWDEGRKNMNNAPKLSTGPDLSRMSSFVLPELTYEEWKERYGSSQPEVTRAISRPGSFNEAHDIMRKQDDHWHKQSFIAYANENGRNSNRDPLLFGYGSKGNNSYYSGSHLAPAGNVNQMLNDRDRRYVQETARHAYVDKGKEKRVQSEVIPLPTNALFVGPINRPHQRKVYNRKN